MKLPLWIRCLPHNLATIRPRIKFEFDLHLWAVGLSLYLDSAPGDKDYLFHFDEAGIVIWLGPLHLGLLLVDTPGTDCEEELRAKGKF